MVGRPKTKAKHVQSLADQQYALNDRPFAECPPMYLDGTDRRDSLAQSWRSAIEAVKVWARLQPPLLFLGSRSRTERPTVLYACSIWGVRFCPAFAPKRGIGRKMGDFEVAKIVFGMRVTVLTCPATGAQSVQIRVVGLLASKPTRECGRGRGKATVLPTCGRSSARREDGIDVKTNCGKAAGA